MKTRKISGDADAAKINYSVKRRQTLTRLTSIGFAGALGPAGILGLIQEALANGDKPTVTGINSLQGSATINGVPAKVGMVVKPGDTIATGSTKGSFAIVVIGKDAYLLRENTRVTFEDNKEQPGVVANVLIGAGKLLSVFAKRSGNARVSIKAQSATIGIRGTGCYIELEPKRTYFCLCYGEASIDGAGMDKTRIVTATHHDSPVWLDETTGSMRLEATNFGSHTDAELIMLEKLTGREPPFVALGLTGKY